MLEPALAMAQQAQDRAAKEAVLQQLDVADFQAIQTRVAGTSVQPESAFDAYRNMQLATAQHYKLSYEQVTDGGSSPWPEIIWNWTISQLQGQTAPPNQAPNQTAPPSPGARTILKPGTAVRTGEIPQGAGGSGHRSYMDRPRDGSLAQVLAAMR
jgi:hypothetical protein